MRKQDRIEQQRRTHTEDAESKPQGPPKEPEQVKGSAPPDRPTRAQREPGKLPLPD